jgi:Putative peptidoglycan binding domain
MATTLKRGDGGELVAELHRALALAGALSTKADLEVATMHFGMVTRAAVIAFQVEAGIEPDGVVGPQTWDALEGDYATQPYVPQPEFGGATGPLGMAMLKVADELWQQRVKEQPAGTNRGSMVDRILAGHRQDGIDLLRWRPDARVTSLLATGWQGAPWCARTALWCLEAALLRLQKVSADGDRVNEVLRGPENPARGWGELDTAHKWFTHAMQAQRLASVPRPGMVGLITGDAERGHVVIVANVITTRENLVVLTREGNTLHAVGARRRLAKSFSGFVDLD